MKSPLMGRILIFRGGGHREMAELLPWHVTGALDDEQRARMEAHLSVCAECRAELALQEQLRVAVAETPLDVEQGWSRMRRRVLEDTAARPRSRPRAAPEWLASPDWLGAPGAAAAAIRGAFAWGGWATAGLLLVAAVVWLSPSMAPARYHALSAKAEATSGNMVVTFRPDTPEHALRDALHANHARLVDGPTDAGGYVLAVPQAERPRALAALRSRAEVSLAQPIDPDLSP